MVKPQPGQKADVWSLGCIFSEAAVWVAKGKAGLFRYRQLRRKSYQIFGLGDQDCSHNGKEIHPLVHNHHDEMLKENDDLDPLARRVLGSNVLFNILASSEKRPSAEAVFVRMQKLVGEAERDIEELRKLSYHLEQPSDENMSITKDETPEHSPASPAKSALIPWTDKLSVSKAYAQAARDSENDYGRSEVPVETFLRRKIRQSIFSDQGSCCSPMLLLTVG